LEKEKTKLILQQTYEQYIKVDNKIDYETIKHGKLLKELGGMSQFFKNFDVEEGKDIRLIIDNCDSIEDLEKMLNDWANFKLSANSLQKAKKDHKLSRLLMMNIRKLNMLAIKMRLGFIEIFMDNLKNGEVIEV
jgi:hypothetical protein